MRLPPLGETEAQLVATTLERMIPSLPRPVSFDHLQVLDAPLSGVLDVVETYDDDEDFDDDADDELTVIVPAFLYGDRLVGIDHVGDILATPNAETLRLKRDVAGEKRLIGALKTTGFHPISRHSLEFIDPLKNLPGKTAYVFDTEERWIGFERDILPVLEAAG